MASGGAEADRLQQAFAAIDAANALDPRRIGTDDGPQPAELAYGQRMSAMLERFQPEAGEALRLAVRAQHIERFSVPRSAFPEGRAGYHRWRNTLKERHADRAAGILARYGYDDATIARVRALIRKENLKGDPEAQALEDVACLVFLQHYLPDFAARQDADKLDGILRRTWPKMSAAGQQAALALPLSAEARAIVMRALQAA